MCLSQWYFFICRSLKSHIVGRNNLLEALYENPSTKEEIMGYINQEDDVVDLEIDDWLTMDSWGNTPAVEEMIPTEFDNL